MTRQQVIRGTIRPEDVIHPKVNDDKGDGGEGDDGKLPDSEANLGEEFRFEGRVFWAIAAGLILAGGLAFWMIWRTAERMGIFDPAARGDDYERVQANVVLLALITLSILLLTVGLILICADIKRLTVNASQSSIAINASGVDTGSLTILSQILDAAANGLSKVRGGSAAVFSGIVLLVVAGWIATTGMAEPAQPEQQDAPAVSEPAAEEAGQQG